MSSITTSKGVKIEYECFGSVNDAPLLLIQGLGAQMVGWPEKFCQQLSYAGFYVIRFDNRDVGLSQKFPHSDYSLADMAFDAVGLLEAMNIPAAHIAGQSMGGMIAQHFVKKYPEKVISLSLIYTCAQNKFIIGGEEINKRNNLPEPKNEDEAAEIYVKNEKACDSLGYETDIEWLKKLGKIMWNRSYDREGSIRQHQAIDKDPDRREGLKNITCPTLIIHGKSDKLIYFMASEELHSIIPDSELYIYPGMGHQLPQPLWNDIIGKISNNAQRT